MLGSYECRWFIGRQLNLQYTCTLKAEELQVTEKNIYATDMPYQMY